MFDQRRILDNQYIRSLHSPKMNLVKDTIASIGPNSLTTTSGEEHKVDFIVG